MKSSVLRLILLLANGLLIVSVSLAIEYPETPLPTAVTEITESSRVDIAAEQRIAADLRFLASDDMRGRGPGTDGLDRAAEYIAERWQTLGLDTNIFGDLPFQTFKIPGSISVADPLTNSLRIMADGYDANNQSVNGSTDNAADAKADGKVGDLRLDEDFRPLSLGGNQAFQGPLCFVGYGITAKESGFVYDDYTSIDVRGKVVVMLRKEPQQADPSSRFAGTSASKHAYFTTKYANAVAHGAAAILFINDGVSLQGKEPANEPNNDANNNANNNTRSVASENDRLPGIEDAGRSNATPSIPVMFIRRELIEPWIAHETGMDLYELEQAIDQDLKPRSVAFAGVSVAGAVSLKTESIELKNVICRVPGVGSLASETVVVGAHYDHVGMGGPGSLSPGVIAVHNGADDNASGTSALLELARKLSPAMNEDTESRRQIVLIAFTGEERGLLGSRHYIKYPRFPIESTVAMINMDMIGRMSDRQLIIYGTGTAIQFPSMIDRVNLLSGFQIRKQSEGYGPSDHQPFYERKVPVLHLFTGLHTDYHRPTDDFEKINTDGIGAITDMVYQMTVELAKSPGKPSYVAVQGKADIRLPIVRRARLGVRLVQFSTDSQESSKVQIESVAEDSPASKASLKPLDVLLTMDRIPIDSPQSLIDALSEKNPGDSVTLEVQRDNERLNIPVTLGQ
ncbi:MAG: M28 family peptidase [Planctomycetota bacterium]|nr:M28 family peptidase [Planctomycetota bacterium]